MAAGFSVMRAPRVGELRVEAQLRKRRDVPGFDMGTSPEFLEERNIDIKIEPVGTAVYAGSVQTDSKITHRVFMRFLAGIDSSYEVVAEGVIYRVNRSSDVAGAKQFTVLEVEEIGEVESNNGK